MNAFIDDNGDIVADSLKVIKENMKVLINLSG